MGYNHNRIKENARLFYKNNAGNAILSILIFIGVSLGFGIALSIILTIPSIMVAMLGAAAEMEEASSQTTMTTGYLTGMIIIYVIELVASLGLYPLTIGMLGWYRSSIFCKTSLGEIFAPYRNGRFWSSVATGFFVILYTFLWSLLFIIPGIIKSFSYSQTFFIKSENPNIPANRAIELSRIMMDGHKGDLLYLHLSFLGWGILSALTYNILGIVYVFPYYYSALSFAYVEIKADAISRGVISASEFNPVQEKYIVE